ncbi:MAG: YgiT-type zinc finger protein [candidate division KSB1 bacterium]|nr:YgiT-type zinc finger protein [candidate division KSB1 bacterium]
MRCIICHSTRIETKTVNEEIYMNSDIIYVPISIPVCSNCGERYYDRRTMQYLEKTKEELQSRSLRLREVGKVKVVETEPIFD